MTFKEALKLTLGIFSTILIFLLMFLVIAPIIHESGHALMAMILGVPFSELEFGWYGKGPGVTVPEYVSQEFLTYFRYAGGLTSGAVLIISYITYLIWQRRVYAQPHWWSKFRWWVGYCLLSPGIYEIFNGYYEGSQYDKYIGGAVPSEIHLWIAIFIPLVINVSLTLLLVKYAHPKVAEALRNC